jgi:hypothetical protein
VVSGKESRSREQNTELGNITAYTQSIDFDKEARWCNRTRMFFPTNRTGVTG